MFSTDAGLPGSGFRCHWLLDRLLSCHRLPGPEQVGNADQVVGHHMQPEHRSHLGPASGLELPQT